MSWNKVANNIYRMKTQSKVFEVELDRPVDRYFARVNNVVIMKPTHPEETLYFWYLKQAKELCEAISEGKEYRLVEGEYASKSAKFEVVNASHRGAVISSISAVRDGNSSTFPSPNKVRAALVQIHKPEDAHWKILDDVWAVLGSSNQQLSSVHEDTLIDYVKEIAVWGNLYRWLQKGDVEIMANALWEKRHVLCDNRNRTWQDSGMDKWVAEVWTSILQEAKAKGISKNQYSWVTKILHWILMDIVPIYDDRVYKQLSKSSTYPQAYKDIVDWEYRCASYLAPHAEAILQGYNGFTLLRAIDAYLFTNGA